MKIFNNSLQNKRGVWVSDDNWNFGTKFGAKDDLFYILNLSQKKYLGITNNDEVILEKFEENKVRQLWKKGKANSEGYFTLENSKVPKLLTASSEQQTIKTVRTVHIDSTGLEILGKHNSKMDTGNPCLCKFHS